MARVLMEYTFDGISRKMANVFDVQEGSNGGPFTPANTIADLWNAAGSLKINCVSSLKLTRVVYSTPVFEHIWVGSFAGTVVAASMPPNVTWLYHKIGGLRRFQGRLFLPGVAEPGANNVGGVEPAYLTNLTSSGNVFLTGLANAGLPMIQKPSAANPTPALVTSLSPDTRVSTQRRRLR